MKIKKSKVKFHCEPLLKRENVITVWGIKGGVGKSTTSALIAASSAFKSKRRTLLIDADFRDGASRFFLGERARNLKGWYDVLEIGGSLDDYTHVLGDGLLHVIPSGTLDSAIKYSEEIMRYGIPHAARKVAQTLFEISEFYDLIVFDTPAASFADIPILKCVIESLNARSVLLSQASITEIERTLRIAEAAMGTLPDIFVINQITPRILTDVNERRLLMNEIMNIVARNVKVLTIPFMSKLYKRILWESSEVQVLLECIAYLIWGKGRPQVCTISTRGLMTVDLAKSIASIRGKEENVQ
ncbi:hypothetical protein EYM_07785 [Ignicoccus islandicus DSM 13165]|uniref:CobQ/CobB/MinD/ParA nucleotide binding domain-containing protein n=1 Tax=Ignicoccus islandicus DSM 13165 TaxID=940295 RepID=A0A0U2WPD7_9CREN|nr:AAA family ATPase [Ignicoccus islandicus]ALU12817.1 hypothetical protein EYM_07785 [Ignicoccus islandicus DSM 13165]